MWFFFFCVKINLLKSQHFRLFNCINIERAFPEVTYLSNLAFRTDEEITRVYEKYVDTVYKVCFMMLKNASETEDATQNVFIKYMRDCTDFKSDEHLKAWLIVTAQNECKNILKHWFRAKRDNIEDVPEASYVDDDSKRYLLEKVFSLDEKYRLPIYLYYYEGYSTSEISEILNTKHSTVRTYMAKGREKLKIILEEEEL